MTLAIEQVAHKLNVSPEQLLRESLRAYVAQQERSAQLDIADLQDRYRVSTAEELLARIKAGEIYSHPAWEDLIEWEHLNAYLKALSDLRAALN
ncbi:MAG: hypothetical protein ACRDH2_00250 [Anaerolineales bacterium]